MTSQAITFCESCNGQGYFDDEHGAFDHWCEACGGHGQFRNYFEIPAGNMPALEAEIEKLNRRAAKLQTEPITIEIVGEHSVEVKDKVFPDLTYTKVYKHVKVHGEAPRVEGWTLMAKITPVVTGEGDDQQVENLLQTVPGEKCPAIYRNTGTFCDHCNTDRYRKDVFVLRDENGQHQQVGRNCLCDFLGGRNPDMILSRAEWELKADKLASDACEEGWGGGFGGPLTVSLDHYVAVVAICSRKLGWVSRGQAKAQGDDFNATADVAWYLCNPPFDSRARKELERYVEKHQLHVTDADKELTAKVVEWAKALPTDASDYIYNLGVAVRMGYVCNKNMGLVASAISAYKREVEKEVAERAKREEAKTLNHLGTVKERMGLPRCKVMRTRSWEGDFGVTTLVAFRTDEGKGDHVVWFASGDVTEDWEVDQVYDITATVKKHDDYKGTPQTVVNRVKEGLPKSKKR